MTAITIRLISMVMAALVFTGCGSIDTVNDTDANEDTFYGTYDSYYHEESSRLSFYVSYRVGGPTGTTVRLSDNSRLTVNGSHMSVRDGDNAVINVTGTYYHFEMTVQSPEPEYKVAWTKTDGEIVENVFKIPPRIAITQPAADFVQKRDEMMTIQVSGDNFSAGETIVCTLSSDQAPQEGEKRNTSVPCHGGTPAVMPIAELTMLPLGPARVSAVRGSQELTPSGHPKGGRIRSSYTTKYLPGTIVPSGQ